MKVIIKPGAVNGNVAIPSSKSLSQRAIAAALIKKGETFIYNYGISNDETAAINIFRQLGGRVKQNDHVLSVVSSGIHPISKSVFCDESGLSARMFLPLIALQENVIEVTGRGSILERNFEPFHEVFNQLGITFKSKKGKLPAIVQGAMKPENILVDGSQGSQMITGLIMAYSALNADQKTISVQNLKSKYYIDLTLDVLNKFGLPVPINENYERFVFNANKTKPSTIHINIEPDWSNASFFIVLAALNGRLLLKGLNRNSLQPDKAILNLLDQLNVDYFFSGNDLVVSNSNSNLMAFSFDATDCPDLFPPLAILATQCNGESNIKGVSRLFDKESNRAASLLNNLSKMKIPAHINNDHLIIGGKNIPRSCTLSSYNDHRIAMAFSIAAAIANDKVQIENADAVNKSYPLFFEHLKQTGIELSLF